MERGAKIFAAIMLIAIIGGIAALVVWINLDDARLLSEGCEAEAWNQYGQVTLWRCPEDVDGGFGSIPVNFLIVFATKESNQTAENMDYCWETNENNTGIVVVPCP